MLNVLLEYIKYYVYFINQARYSKNVCDYKKKKIIKFEFSRVVGSHGVALLLRII